MAVGVVLGGMASGLAELPGALAAYAVGIAAAAGRGAFYAFVFLVVFAGTGFAPVGVGALVLLVMTLLPAVAAGAALELPRRLLG